jgi:hypothetical protein
LVYAISRLTHSAVHKMEPPIGAPVRGQRPIPGGESSNLDSSLAKTDSPSSSREELLEAYFDNETNKWK